MDQHMANKVILETSIWSHMVIKVKWKYERLYWWHVLLFNF